MNSGAELTAAQMGAIDSARDAACARLPVGAGEDEVLSETDAVLAERLLSAIGSGEPPWLAADLRVALMSIRADMLFFHGMPCASQLMALRGESGIGQRAAVLAREALRYFAHALESQTEQALLAVTAMRDIGTSVERLDIVGFVDAVEYLLAPAIEGIAPTGAEPLPSPPSHPA